jgi:hypothetical protein
MERGKLTVNAVRLEEANRRLSIPSLRKREDPDLLPERWTKDMFGDQI